MKLLLYSHDTYGLGNIRRMLAIATYLSESVADLSILLVSGSPMLHAFRIPPQIDYVKLPCLSRTESGEYVSPYLGLEFEEVIRLRSNLILSTVLDFQPDLLLVDKKPLGLGGELKPAIEVLDRRVDQPRKILLLRDILDSPPVTRAIWKRNGYFDVLAASYDQVLVVGDQQLFAAGEEYAFPPDIKKITHYCGYMARQQELHSRSDIRNELDIGDERLVLVTTGGGADGCELLENYLQGLHDNKGTDFHSLILTGPEMSIDECRFIRELAAKCPKVHLCEFTSDMMSYMSAADVVVSMGGYNTVCELLTLKKRAIIVPRTEPVMEQCIRAEYLAKKGLVNAIHPDELTPDILISAVNEALHTPGSDTSIPYKINMDGLVNIRKNLFESAVTSGDDRQKQHRSVSYTPVELSPVRGAVLQGR